MTPTSPHVGGAAATSSEHTVAMTWSAFYKQARTRMASYYGIRGIPVDAYKMEYCEEMTDFDVVVACQHLFDQLQAKTASPGSEQT